MANYLQNLASREKTISIAMAVVFVVVAYFGYGFAKDVFFDPAKELLWGGQRIVFAFTDDNSNEDLIIRTDKKDYSGFNKSIIYFNISNKSPRDQKVESAFYFENGAKLESIHVLEDENWVDLELHKQDYVNMNNPNRKSVEGLKSENSFNQFIEEDETRYFKATIFYPPMSSGKFFVESFGHRGAYGHLDPWYNSSWSYRKKITIDPSKVPANATNFPVLATTTDSDLSSKARSDGYDIVFTDEDGNDLNWEREKYVSGTGELVAWVQTNLSSTTETTLYMYYGNADSTDQATTTGVWDDNYVGVWHLAHNGTATTTYPDFLDSTKNNQDGSSANMNASDLVDTQIDGGLDFDGVNDYVDTGDHARSGDFSWSFWVNANGLIGTSGAILYDGANVNTNQGCAIAQKTTSNLLEFECSNGSTRPISFLSNTAITDDGSSWSYITVVVDVDVGATIYFDGQSDNSQSVDTSSDNFDASRNFYIASRNPADRYFKGKIDETRVSNVAKTSGWILTEYNNQLDVSAFLTFWSEEGKSYQATANSSQSDKFTTGLVGHWTFDGPDMYSNVADVSGQGNHGSLVLGASGNTSTTTSPGKLGQALDFDGTDDYVDVGNVYNGVKTISFWMKTDQSYSKKIIDIDATDQIELDGTSNVVATSFPGATVYVDGVAASAVATSTWHHVVITDSTGVNASAMDIGRVSASYFDGQLDGLRMYSAVLSADEIGGLYRLGQNKLNVPQNTKHTSGLVGHWTFDGPDMYSNVADVSGSANHGSLDLGVSGNTSTTTSPGKLGQALDFDGTDDYVDAGTGSSLEIQEHTLTAWIYPNSIDYTNTGIIASKADDITNSGVEWGLRQSTGDLALAYNDGAARGWYISTNSNLTVGRWYHVAVAWRKGDAEADFYVDGVKKDTISTTSGTITYLSDTFRIGYQSQNSYFNGDIDDVRVYDRALSADEVSQLYRTGSIKFK